jgi:hypothetical protein
MMKSLQIGTFVPSIDRGSLLLLGRGKKSLLITTFDGQTAVAASGARKK